IQTTTVRVFSWTGSSFLRAASADAHQTDKRQKETITNSLVSKTFITQGFSVLTLYTLESL
ncbi:hypothetical protein, partial [Halorubellus sp. PRR65]|uniref:hypothetical protein n=1 Tax=Halorubellus sp. PRR65 TaxID=3098148 RepID=UPI002B25B286